jgi:hypothetical protein
MTGAMCEVSAFTSCDFFSLQCECLPPVAHLTIVRGVPRRLVHRSHRVQSTTIISLSFDPPSTFR